jgi:hypothetical protein
MRKYFLYPSTSLTAKESDKFSLSKNGSRYNCSKPLLLNYQHRWWVDGVGGEVGAIPLFLCDVLTSKNV